MKNKEQIIRRTREAIMAVLDGLSLLGVIEAQALHRTGPKDGAVRITRPTKARVTVNGKLVTRKAARSLDKAMKANGSSRLGSKTAKILAVLADGKPHSAKELALAGGVTPGHVYQHLRSRMESHVVKKAGPGLFQLNGKKAKAA